MKRTLRKARTLLTVYYAQMLEYRAEIVLWLLSGSLPIILMGIWMQAAQGGKFELTPIEFARYFVAVFFVRQFSIVWVIWDFEKEVVEGKLSMKLLQPLDPGWHHFVGHISERFARLPFILALVALFFILYPQAFWIPSLPGLLLCMLALAMAFVLRFLIQYTFAMFAFWIERAAAIDELWLLVYIFLSGVIAPLELFPVVVRQIVLWTPFPYLIYFPAGLLMGLPVDVLKGFLVMLGWSLLFFICNRWLWHRGLKKYSGMGA